MLTLLSAYTTISYSFRYSKNTSVQFTSTDTAQTRLEKLENLLRDYNVPTIGQEAEGAIGYAPKHSHFSPNYWKYLSKYSDKRKPVSVPVHTVD